VTFCTRCGQEIESGHICEPVLVDGAVYSELDGSFVCDPEEETPEAPFTGRLIE
jgi:hypothetical protein